MVSRRCPEGDAAGPFPTRCGPLPMAGGSLRWRAFFEAWQVICQLDPAELVTRPNVRDGRKCVRLIEATGCYVNGWAVVGPPIRQWRTTASAERSRYGGRRVVFDGFSSDEQQCFRVQVKPRHDCCRGCFATTSALTRAAHQWFAPDLITDGAAQTSTLNRPAHRASPWARKQENMVAALIAPRDSEPKLRKLPGAALSRFALQHSRDCAANRQH